jgi:hypothetical protein
MIMYYRVAQFFDDILTEIHPKRHLRVFNIKEFTSIGDIIRSIDGLDPVTRSCFGDNATARDIINTRTSFFCGDSFHIGTRFGCYFNGYRKISILEVIKLYTDI